MRHVFIACAVTIALACLLPVAAQSNPTASALTSLATNAPANAPLSTRVVHYGIDAHIDAEKKSLDATESLTYTNLTGQPLTTFPFHLYLNAFQPTSTFTSETHFSGGIRDSESADDYPAKKLGSITLTQITADSFGDLTPLLHFIAPDDNNANDHTVAQLELPRALAPGASVTFHIRFHDQFPESVARNGYKRDFLMGGQWYPKLGVYWHGAWNCHQYHSTTEFFSDFGTFNVRLTLPRNYILGASGIPTGETLNPDDTRTSTFYGEDIHDFAWAASPHFTVTDGTYQSSIGPVKVHVLALAAHPHAGQRYLKILLASLAEFDKRYGPYPYKMLTLVDPEPDSEMGGMEYPTLVTGDASLWDPTFLQEITAEHEFGHQYWYGMVATNEFEEAWLDEGINSYTETKVMGAILGQDTSAVKFRWANMSDFALQYIQYIQNANYDPVTRPAWQFHNVSSYGGVTYGKSAMLLSTLEGLLGAATMDEAMRTYFERFRFQHPTTEDFLRTIEEAAQKHGRTGLRPFFTQAVYGTQTLDYAIDSIASSRLEWWLPETTLKDSASTQLRNTVTVHRLGDFLLPVTLKVTFEDGTSLRQTWDGGASTPGASTPGTSNPERWHTFTFLRNSAIASAEIDPDHILALDVDTFNNSKVVKSNTVPANKLTALWLTGLQFASQIAGWLI